MSRTDTNDLLAFLAIARERSFTRAAAKLGVSQSALSHSLRGLESRLGLRLLNRTTRSVSPTEAGERLQQRIGPRFEEIDAELAALSELRDKPAGTIRISATDHVANAILLPKLQKFLADYPDVTVEIDTDMRFVDIVALRYDAGVREGEQVAKDMIAVRIGPDMRMAVVGAPAYFKQRPTPKKPQDLTGHNCINLRLLTRGGLYAWEFENRRRKLNVHVEGQLVFNSGAQMLHAALAGYGLAYVLEDVAKPFVDKGQLKRVLKTGAHRSRAITCTTRAVASICRRLPYSSRHCVTGTDRARKILEITVPIHARQIQHPHPDRSWWQCGFSRNRPPSGRASHPSA